MSFDSFHDFLAMGGHAPYVWWSYVAGAAVLGLDLAWLARRRRRTVDAVRRAEDRSREER